MKVIFFFKSQFAISIIDVKKTLNFLCKYILYFVVIVLVRLPIWNANDYHFSILFGQKKAGKRKKKSLTHHHISSTGMVKFP